MTHGGRFAGYGLYVIGGKPVFHYNLAGVERYNLVGNDKLTPGNPPSHSPSNTKEAASARAAPRLSPSTARRWLKPDSRGPSRSGFHSMRL